MNHDLLNLHDKHAIITGGASGIGKSITKLFAKAGAYVTIIELNADAARETVGEVIAEQGKGGYQICDIADQSQVNKIFSQLSTPIDILVNNAGIAHVGNLASTHEHDFDKLFQVNVKGTYNCMQAAINKMIIRNRGVILNMASIAAMVGLPDRFAYSMTKGAVLAMTYSVARDYIKFNIRCNCISPARIHTPFVDGFIRKNYPGQEAEMFDKLSKSQPIGRMGTSEEVAQLALYLCSDQSNFITGTNYPIDGGFINLNT